MRGLTYMTGLVAVGLLALTGCAPSYGMVASPQAPAASGKIMTKSGPNNSTEMRISVKNLAPASELSPNSQTYVVWVKGEQSGAQPQNVGAIQVGTDLKGQLDTMTQFKTFDVWVTPESSPAADAPSTSPVLTGHIAPKYKGSADLVAR